ncbi:MAG: hydantoinase B/oxoprolinase family protein [Armatimonadetes bacterium]|nr:hydantoinase B/oxoprolinase family protein [Armatimonadota bacterium]
MLRTLNHEEPDRVPLDIGGTIVSTIRGVAYSRLKQYLGIVGQDVIESIPSEKIVVEEDILDLLHVDTQTIRSRPPHAGKETKYPDGRYVNEWGIEYQVSESDGQSYASTSTPLADATIADIDAYDWPNPEDPGRTERLREDAERLYAQSSRALVGSVDKPSIFEVALAMRGFSKLLEDMVAQPRFACLLLEKVAEIQIRRYERFLDACGPYLNVIAFADDVGMQNGLLDEELMSFINQNVRTTFESRGDIMAQVAANNVGSRRLREVIGRYDEETIAFYMRALMDYSEARMRAGIRNMPKGKFYHEDFIEGTPLTKKLIKISASIEIKEDSVFVDFSGSDDQQPDSINSTIVTANAGVYYVFRCLIDPDIPPNAGAYRPFEVKVRHGSVVAAKFPAPVCNSTIITSPKVVDVLLGALLDAFKDKTQAASYGVTTILNVGGKMPESDNMYSYVETYAGGQGAMAELDGMDAVQTHMTNTRNTPVEVIEATYPLFVKEYSMVPDSEGAGRRRGGVGLMRSVTALTPNTKVSVSTDRHEITPWGAFGGKNAAPSHCLLADADGKESESLCTKFTTQLKQGENVTIITPGGGGWGSPFEREPEKVRWDVLEGLVSIERARDVYGVVIDSKTLEVNNEETRRLRAAGAAAPIGGQI